MLRNAGMRVTVWCTLALVTLWSSAGAAQQPLDLFSEPSSVPAQDPATDKGVVRARYVAIDFADLAAAASSRSEITLNLFAGAAFKAVIDAVDAPSADASTITGHLAGIDGSSVTLVSADGVMIGSITTPDAQYQVRYAGNGVHVVREFDPSQLPERADDVVVPDAADMGPALDPQVATDSGNRIDVLVVWTPAARAANGGTTAIRNLINLGITETNQAYANSGVVQRLRLVHMSEISYTETGALGTDLGRLRATSDGFLDSVHSLRNTYGADMVKLVVNNGDGCGIAYLMGPGHSTAFAPNGFSVTVDSCISPNYTFGHELGHNMGNNHAPIDPVGTGAYSYSYGYKKLTSPTFRTVMSYVDSCPSPCPRVLHFSNPGVNYVISGVGYPTGTNNAWGASTAQNNALSMNNTRTSVGNWRQQVPLIVIDSLWTVYKSGTSSTPQSGQPARFWAYVRNIGPNPLASNQRVWFYLENQAGSGDRWMAPANISGLAPGAGAWYSIDYNLPVGISGGWQYWAITYDGSEYTSAWRGPQTFNVLAAPTYSANVTSLWPVSGAQGGKTSRLWAQVWNNGLAALPADARVWFYVTGPSYGSWVGSAAVAGLASNASAWYYFDWTIPASAVGAYQYRASVWRSGTTLISNTAGPQAFSVAAAPAVAANIDSLWPIYNGVPGGSVTMWALVRNTGTSTLPVGTRVYYWLNGEVGSTAADGIPSGGSAWRSFNYAIPSGWTGGIYSYWAQARNGGTVISSWAGPQYFTIGFNSQFSGSTSPWIAVRGSWVNASSAWYYTGGITSQYSTATYSSSTFTNQDVSAAFWDNGANTDFTCLAVRGTLGTQTAIGEWQNAYIFCYRRDGNYGVWKRVNHVWTALRSWTATGTIVQGSAWNVLRARAIGSSLAFYINNTLLYSGSDSSLSSGRTGIWTYGSGGLWTDYYTLNSGNAVPDEAADEAADSAGDSAVSAEQQAIDAANRQSGGDDPAAGVGASLAPADLPNRTPTIQ